MSVFISVGTVAVGIGLLVSGSFLYLRRRAFLKRAVTAVGEVVELLPLRQSGEYRVTRTAEGVKFQPKYLYRPVIRFKAANGRSVKFTANVASSPQPYQVGDTVEIIYDPAAPSKAAINRSLYRWFYVGMLLFFGVFCVMMGLVGILLAA